MSTNDPYLAVFLSNKTSPRWQAWYAMSGDERRAKDEEGLAALKAWDEEHQGVIAYSGGPLGKTKLWRKTLYAARREVVHLGWGQRLRRRRCLSRPAWHPPYPRRFLVNAQK